MGQCQVGGPGGHLCRHNGQAGKVYTIEQSVAARNLGQGEGNKAEMGLVVRAAGCTHGQIGDVLHHHHPAEACVATC